MPIGALDADKDGFTLVDTGSAAGLDGSIANAFEKKTGIKVRVVALGTGKRDEDGKLIEFTVKKGDKVLISKYGGTEVKIDGDSYLIMREDDILGIIG